MKKYLLILCALMSSVLTFGAVSETYMGYVQFWRAEAIRQQQTYGVPAAITLAQGLLESAAGQSDLCNRANNHFGIKATNDWTGGVVQHKGSAYRKYDDAADSYRDHSLFLRRSRYSALFELEPTDYEHWAQGLKTCGYAEDPLYPEKLIRIIEEYDLNDITREAIAAPTTIAGVSAAAVLTANKNVIAPVVVSKAEPIAVMTQNPEEPYVEPLTAYQERKAFYKSHLKNRMNGVSYVLAIEGDTYANVAFRLNVKERTLREHNDALGRTLMPGDRIYLAQKPKYGLADHSPLWVHPDESLWAIAQREGMQLETIYKLNELSHNVRSFKTRQTILIRKPKKEK